MGCDIHLYVEHRDYPGAWTSADKWTSVPDDELEEGESPRLRVEYEDRIYSGRNYNLFAILANVRNGHGFAGIKTGDGFKPICLPRGLPKDVTPAVRAESDGWGGDGHSHSWLTVAELLEYDWTQTSNLQGVLNVEEFEQWERYDKKYRLHPESYSGGVSGRGVKHVTNDQMRDLLKPIAEISGPEWREGLDAICAANPSTYTTVEWKEPYYSCASKFLGKTLPQLWRLGKPENVRIVFWFDN